MKTVIIDGLSVNSAKDVHLQLAKELDFGPYYGKNYDALWDMLTGEERPFIIIWKNASVSRQKMQFDFNQFISLFEKLVVYDANANFSNCFSFFVEE